MFYKICSKVIISFYLPWFGSIIFYSHVGAMTFSITTFSLTTLSIMTFSITEFSIKGSPHKGK
jgi:hypothetical protein